MRSRNTLFLLIAFVSAFPLARSVPIVNLDQGTFVGQTDILTGTDQFLGIPFAIPPVDDLRFRVPLPNEAYTGSYDVSAFGPACIQEAFLLEQPLLNLLVGTAIGDLIYSLYGAVTPQSEDCLTINVFRPAGISPTAMLPVVAWMYGGGFSNGRSGSYPGGQVVGRSIALGQPIIYVSMNYRLAAYGFLASAEVKAAGVGNLGVLDQRLALRWIQKYISAFGGDPQKVTLWGQSAGAISIGVHLVANGGDPEGLFRGAIMQSGSPLPVGDITHGQEFYDLLVDQTGCTGSADTLQCLRGVPADVLSKAMNRVPGLISAAGLHFSWQPRVDGAFITDNPQELVLDGKVARVPFITGVVDDEGTLFTVGVLNVITDQQVRNYMAANYFTAATTSAIDEAMRLYPQDITKGSPYDTGILNAIGPQYKRIASFQGDVVFHGPRRFLLQQVSDKQNSWSYLSKRYKFLPALGSAHLTDLLLAYGSTDFTDYVVNFVNNLDPNGKTVPYWPKYTTVSPQLMTLLDGIPAIKLSNDTYRQDAIDFVQQLALQNPL